MRTPSLLFVAATLSACGEDLPPMGDFSGTCTVEMYDTYGDAAFGAVADSIIGGAVMAPTSEVGNSFQYLAEAGDARVQEFRTNLIAFLVLVYGGPDEYAGPDMVTAHAELGITSEQYDYFVANVIVPALVDNGVPQGDIDGCFAPPVVDPGLKARIVSE